MDTKLLLELENILYPNEVAHILKIMPTLYYSLFSINSDYYYSTVWLDEYLSQILFHRLKPYIPNIIEGKSFYNINDAFRVYRYDPGIAYRTTNKDIILPYGNKPYDKSILSIMIFLNDNYHGGEVVFGNRVIIPKLGKVVIYDNSLEYSVNRVTEYHKYELNTNILTYNNIQPSSISLPNIVSQHHIPSFNPYFKHI